MNYFEYVPLGCFKTSMLLSYRIQSLSVTFPVVKQLLVPSDRGPCISPMLCSG